MLMALLEKGLRPREIVTRRSPLENAVAVKPLPAFSTNSALHLYGRWRHEAGIDFGLGDEVVEVFARMPYIADMQPGGRYLAKDLHEINGVQILMRALLDGGYLHGDCMTVTGKSIAENLADIRFPADQDVVRTTAAPLDARGGVTGLTGNLAPQGSVCKVAGLKRRVFSGPARIFDSEEDCLKAVLGRAYQEGDVLVIRCEGPKGGSGTREMISTTAALYAAAAWARRWQADHRRSLFRREPAPSASAMIGPEAAIGGPIGLIRDGDTIRIDADSGLLAVDLSDAELEERRMAWKPHPTHAPTGALWRYAQTVSGAERGAVVHPGAAAEMQAYADI